MRTALFTALLACADPARKLPARQFLVGLSADELQFIAEFLGASILEPWDTCRFSRAELAQRIEEFRGCRHAAQTVGGSPSSDEEHKMILLLEYLCRCAIHRLPAPLWPARA